MFNRITFWAVFTVAVFGSSLTMYLVDENLMLSTQNNLFLLGLIGMCGTGIAIMRKL